VWQSAATLPPSFEEASKQNLLFLLGRNPRKGRERGFALMIRFDDTKIDNIGQNEVSWLEISETSN
jgi:hypothetical protein